MNLHPWLRFDSAQAVQAISMKMREAIHSILMKKGAVVAVSGGIDSAVCAALAVESLGRNRVFALLLPEKDSSPSSLVLGENLCNHLGIAFEIMDIAPTLDAIGCYSLRDEAIRSVFPEYREGWKSKIALSQNLSEKERLNFFKLIVEAPDGARMEKRIPLKPYLQLVAATNFKQRVRKTMEYYHADRLNYAVLGTPNRLEYDQGFFVKNGDGSADVKPIAHLYKSQIYELGGYLGLPISIRESVPTTDTYSLEQGQDEFYFVLPYEKMDIVLYGMNHGKPAQEVGMEIGLSVEQVERIFRDIQSKRRATLPLHLRPLLAEPVPEIQPT